MKIKFRKMLLCLTSILALGIFMGGVSAENVGDISSDIDGGTGSGCDGKDSCWLYADGGVGHPVYGIRISIVDNNGNLVSKKAVDYLATKAWAYKVNNNKSYYRYSNTNGGIVNRISLLLNPSSASLRVHNGSEIAKIWPTSLGTLPYMYDDTMDIASYIKNKIINLEEEQLISLFFNDLGYSVPNDSILENHYMIIEPLTMVSAFNKTKIYYGTYYELTKELIGTYNYQNSSNGKSWIASVLDMKLPLSMYITGNEDIYGYNSSTGTYFNGKLKIAKDKYTWYQESKDRTRVTTDYVKDGTIGYGIGIIAMDKLKIERPTCDLSKPEHFASATSGPGGIDCCEYVIDNLGSYGILKSELFTKYSRCAIIPEANECTINPLIDYPVCGWGGSFYDDGDWSCIYDSAYSNDDTWQNYFLKYEEDSCSVYCRDEIDFRYPTNGVSVLAGHRFNIGTTASSYNTYIEDNITKVKPAILGPIQSIVKRECRIIGTANDNCKREVDTQMSSLKAPKLTFSYKSNYYKNTIFSLIPTNQRSDAMEPENKENAIVYQNNLITNYALPDDSSVFRFVTTDGISYRKTSEIGAQTYTDIGGHLPIHFGEKKGKNDYTITIDSFNSENFNKYINKKDTIKSSFETTIETYVKRLIDELFKENKLLKQVNGIYYFSDTFKNRLEKKYTIDNFLSMTYKANNSEIHCANTNNYICGVDTNGIYCLNRNTNTNSEETYTKFFRDCINNVDTIIDNKHGYNNSNYLFNTSLTCQFNINNLITPPGEPDPGNPDVNVIFRQISLNNPFPGSDGNGREVGANWGYGEDYSPANEVVRKVIKNNRGVETDKVYKELDPLYKITLTPAIIKQIRDYNEDNAYDDVEKLKCDSEGNKCTSQFIRGAFAQHFTGCGITNASVGLTCNKKESWNTIDSGTTQY